MAKKIKIEGVDSRSPGARRARGLTKVSVWLDENSMTQVERIRTKLEKDACNSFDHSVTAAIRLALEVATKKKV